MEITPTGRLDFDQTDVKVFRKYARHRCRGRLRPTALQEQRGTIEQPQNCSKCMETASKGLTAGLLPPCFQFLQRLQSIPVSLGPHPPMKPPANFKYSRVHWELYICKAALAGWAVRYLNPRTQRQRQRPADLCWVIVWGQLSFHSKFQASWAIKREPVSKVNKQINKCDLSNI